MPDSGLFRAFRLVFWVVSHPTRPLRNPRTEQNCLRPRKRHSVLQTVFYLALENFLFRSVMKLLGFSRIDAPDEVFVETPWIEHPWRLSKAFSSPKSTDWWSYSVGELLFPEARIWAIGGNGKTIFEESVGVGNILLKTSSNTTYSMSMVYEGSYYKRVTQGGSMKRKIRNFSQRHSQKL